MTFQHTPPMALAGQLIRNPGRSARIAENRESLRARSTPKRQPRPGTLVVATGFVGADLPLRWVQIQLTCGYQFRPDLPLSFSNCTLVTASEQIVEFLFC
jgi:hypothetical protein